MKLRKDDRLTTCRVLDDSIVLDYDGGMQMGFMCSRKADFAQANGLRPGCRTWLPCALV